jgi:phage protein U
VLNDVLSVATTVAATVSKMTYKMMILGDYPFSILTAAYDNLQHSTEYNWQSQQRLGRKPAQQFTGFGEETISLSGLMLPDFSGGMAQIVAMRESAAKGEPLILIDGNGFVMGKWCITKISNTNTVFLGNGSARKIEFSMDLKAYGEDDHA